ncbi:hypothetical protein LUZ62_044800 [Rhynchospora pubera]|uniref:Uncharacterized protein n=1 Tax=Rhynchospora pubera TaxID=906938 RepID=A0AAV8CD85_9POAL|nr:hypothetical protein LUZ62_087859 [Rhynchospora pubera]KAJ4793554.1 hypothetical protein LUZ62_044800 [Rhynchospora pubera]
MSEASTTACSLYRSSLPLIGGSRRGESNKNLVIRTWRKSWKELGIAIPPVRVHPAYQRRGIVANARASSSSAQVVTYSSRISTDIPLYEPPGVTFDEYLCDRPRIFKAMFPDEHRSKRLNEDEWRIQMLPLQFLLVTVNPVVVMRICCKSHGNGYPPLIPEDTTSLLELQATEWELQGLDGAYKPTDFSLGVKGLLYPKREGGSGRLKGHLDISISCILPPALALVPENILRGVAESVLGRLAERMKKEVDVGLLADFRKFRREKLMKNSSREIGFHPPVPEMIGDV